MSSAVETILAVCMTEGGTYDADLHAKDPTSYVMTRPMSDAVRTAGESDASLSYAQTLGAEDPQEGFIDEADETMIMFPFPPGMVEAARAEAHRGTSWQVGLALIVTAIGGAELVRGLFHGAFDGSRSVVGLLFLVAAVLLFRRGKRAKPR